MGKTAVLEFLSLSLKIFVFDNSTRKPLNPLKFNDLSFLPQIMLNWNDKN